MRKEKHVKINDKEITVRELKIKEVEELLVATVSAIGGDKETAVSVMEKYWPSVIIGVTLDQIREDWTFSDFEKLEDAFKEVNAFFFERANQLGLWDRLREMAERVSKIFIETYTALLAKDMGR
jgi:hypothetical protein